MTRRPSRRALLLLWLGIAALAMNAFAGVAHLRAATGGGKLAIEICTPQGIIRVAPAALAAADSPQPASDHATRTGCCDLCGAAGAPAIASASDIPQFPVILAAIDARAPPSGLYRPHPHPALTPLVPRGPPRLS